MKRCPTCNKTFTDQNLSFCIDDGTPLIPVEDPPDETTVVAPSASAAPSNVPAYQAPPAHSSTPAATKRKTWPWVVGILGLLLILFVGLGIAAVVLIPRMVSGLSNANSDTNSNRRVVVPLNNANENTNSNTNDDNANTSVDETPAPTDKAEVLSTLTDLEQEWTVANINADKKKLDRILADDYVGSDANNETQGKADYLRTIERDTTIQKWEFEDLDVTLSGNRASLTGIIRLQVNDHPVAYRFTDKFVWREGRWQATGSQVTPVK